MYVYICVVRICVSVSIYIKRTALKYTMHHAWKGGKHTLFFYFLLFCYLVNYNIIKNPMHQAGDTKKLREKGKRKIKSSFAL